MLTNTKASMVINKKKLETSGKMYLLNWICVGIWSKFEHQVRKLNKIETAEGRGKSQLM